MQAELGPRCSGPYSSSTRSRVPFGSSQQHEKDT